MSDEIAQLGFNREAIGRGGTDLLDNQIAIMRALLLMPEVQRDKALDIKQALDYRISQTASLLMGQAPVTDESSQ